jgi:SAM-dependent methyltransferase
MVAPPVPAGQFALARGRLAGVAGRVMAWETGMRTATSSTFSKSDPTTACSTSAVGPGSRSAAAAERGVRLAGVDPSVVMVAQSRRRLRRRIATGTAEVVEAPAERLPLPDASFSAATAVDAHHPGDVREVLAELARVLQPGGRSPCGVPARSARASTPTATVAPRTSSTASSRPSPRRSPTCAATSAGPAGRRSRRSSRAGATTETTDADDRRAALYGCAHALAPGVAPAARYCGAIESGERGRGRPTTRPERTSTTSKRVPPLRGT